MGRAIHIYSFDGCWYIHLRGLLILPSNIVDKIVEGHEWGDGCRTKCYVRCFRNLKCAVTRDGDQMRRERICANREMVGRNVESHSIDPNSIDMKWIIRDGIKIYAELIWIILFYAYYNHILAYLMWNWSLRDPQRPQFLRRERKYM